MFNLAYGRVVVKSNQQNASKCSLQGVHRRNHPRIEPHGQSRQHKKSNDRRSKSVEGCSWCLVRKQAPLRKKKILLTYSSHDRPNNIAKEIFIQSNTRFEK